ncbi:ABC transporter ATP-binding protein [Patescibacteria group bacterium]
MLIHLEDIKKEYVNGDVVTRVLQGISFDIKKGEFVSIMGPSGSGKSTLMHIVGFLDKASSGLYKFNDKDVTELDEDILAEMRNFEVGFVFQSFNLLSRTTVLDNVKLPLLYSKMVKTKHTEQAKKSLESVGLSHRLEHLSNQLSGGEKQRVAIARALVNDPEVIFADEPTGNLDSKSGKQVMEILQKLNDEGKTIILVTHEKYTAEHADRIIRLLDGKLVSDKNVDSKIRADKEDELVK